MPVLNMEYYIKQLKKSNFFVMSLAFDKTWYNFSLSNNAGVGCILEKDKKDGNITVQVMVTTNFGHFKYMKLSASFIGKSAFTLAINRCKLINEAIKDIK